jgi:hypothetical protein
MSDTVFDLPLVRSYLRELQEASLTLPAAQARELREQIAAHLDEALPPGATDDEVLAELERLGRPGSVVAAAAGPGRRPFGRQARNVLSHVRWWAWALAGLLVAAASTGAGLLISMRTAAPLRPAGLFGWYYQQDGARQVFTQAGDTRQVTIPQRYRQEQGIILTIANDSNWTQTVIGTGPFPWVPFSNMPPQVAVGSDKEVDLGGMDNLVRWSFPGSIPSHSIRMLRVLWDSNVCWIPGTQPNYIQDIMLTVRVGTVTKTEDIQLNFAVALSGNKGAQCK